MRTHLLIPALLLACAVAHAADETAWTAKAEKAFNAQCTDNAEALAKSLLACTHPSGKKAKISSHSATDDGAVVTAVVTLAWNGALSGDDYVTTITWKFDKSQHLSAKVTQDTAKISVDAKHKKELDKYFKESMFPAVSK